MSYKIKISGRTVNWDVYVEMLLFLDKLRKGWNKFVDKMKSKKAKKKKMKRVEQEIMWRFMGVQGDVSNEDDVSSREGSVHGQQDSDRVRLHTSMCIDKRWQFVEWARFIVTLWPNTIRTTGTVIWRTTWHVSRRTWWNSSCRTRCGVLATGLSASLMWVINISDWGLFIYPVTLCWC